MTSHKEAVASILDELPQLDWITDSSRLVRLSSDFSWFSPVLKRVLAGKHADAVVRPTTEQEIGAVVASCVRRRVPITIRGSGTGNYGQATPLAGGVVLDLSAYDRMLWVQPGIARGCAGMRIGDFEAALRPSGQEVRCMPSTYRSATLGGLFGGGFGGIGSINYGPLAAPGNVLGVRAMTIEAEPECVELRGAEAIRMHHLWGTNGLVLELELGTAPAHPWAETIVAFDAFEPALAFADALANAPGIIKREVAFFARPVPDLLRPLRAHLPEGCHAVLSLVAESSEPALLELAARHHGAMAYRQSAAEVQASNRTLMEFTWNHTTLHAIRTDPKLTYLQTNLPVGMHVQGITEMEALFAGEVLTHVEFIRNLEGVLQCSGLPLVRFTTEARLNEIIAIHRERGQRINNPHVNTVEDGRAGGALPEGALATKARFDPHGLLNPGKLRSVEMAAA
jgi:FAD/FMN-containing dehydrogenase